MRKIGEVALTQHEKNKRHYAKHRDEELARNKEYYKTYYPANRERLKNGRRNRRHQITQDWFDAQITKQDNRCAVCLKIFQDTPHVDHDHRCCSELRSCDRCRRDLLCRYCNVLIGMSFDSVEILQKAIQYLRKHNAQ